MKSIERMLLGEYITKNSFLHRPDYGPEGGEIGAGVGAGAGLAAGWGHAKGLWDKALETGMSPGGAFELKQLAQKAGLNPIEKLIAALGRSPLRSAVGHGGIGALAGAGLLGALGYGAGHLMNPAKRWYHRD